MKNHHFLLILVAAFLFGLPIHAQKPENSAPKVAEASTSNPMIWADVPDPDIIRVGDDFYLISTTMHLMPGAPIMRSRDLAHWETIGYVFPRLTDSPKYDLKEGTVYGRGQWATSLKYHNGRFYVLFAPNEAGSMGDTYIYSATDPAGQWTLVSRMRHFHDASLFFDDDNRVYVVYGTGEMCELKSDLSGVIEGSERRIFTREADEKGLLEGSRMVKHNGRYYLLMISHVWAPGRHRREVCYRADNIQGPYEKRTILETDFGGFGYIGQGTIVDSKDGDWYGVIFQDRGGVGRVPLLMPCRWIDGWPVLGDEQGHVPEKMRPLTNSAASPLSSLPGIVGSDSFDGSSLSYLWQWNHNPVDEAWSLWRGQLQLKTSRVVKNLYEAPNTLTQRMCGPTCAATVKLDVSHLADGDCAGLAAFNGHSGVLTVCRNGSKYELTMSEQEVKLTEKEKAIEDVQAKAVETISLGKKQKTLWLRIDGNFRSGRDIATFYYSTDGKEWNRIGSDYHMQFDYRRLFMGTKYALFCYATKRTGGYALFDDFTYTDAIASTRPLVYDQENTGNHFAPPAMPGYDRLPESRQLPDVMAWSNGKGRVQNFADWEHRRNEIAAEIQHYGIGEKPAVPAEAVKARMQGDTLVVDVTVNGQTLTLRSEIQYPKNQQPPYALMLGTSGISLPRQLFADRPIATMTFHEKQVNDYGQWGRHHERGEHDFDRLYPQLSENGAYSMWAWGVSRLIDGLQQLGPEVTKIDTRHIGVTGCSYAGKMALYSGAFDERIALTIAQEPGGGGAAAWRVSHTLVGVEDLDHTDYHWFKESMRTTFAGDSVYRMPYDQHELCAMICPRALLILGNPDYKWLADVSALESAKAAREVWRRFGIDDRMGWSIVGGHPHCQLPEVQFPEVQAFIDKFLLGREADTQGIMIYKP